VHFFIGLPRGFFNEISNGVAAIIFIIVLIFGGFQIKETRELNNYYRQNCQIGKKMAGELHYELNNYFISGAESGNFDELIDLDSKKHNRLNKIVEAIKLNEDCFAPSNIKNAVLEKYRFGHLVPVWCEIDDEGNWLDIEAGFRKSHNENPIEALKAAERASGARKFTVEKELPRKETSGDC